MKWSVIGWNQRMKNQKLISNSESKFKNRNRLLDNLPCFKNNILITAPIEKGDLLMKINKVIKGSMVGNETWCDFEVENITYHNCCWDNIRFKKVTFKNCMFRQSIFLDCEFNNCVFIECRFINNVYKNVELKDTNIENITNNLTLACEVSTK